MSEVKAAVVLSWTLLFGIPLLVLSSQRTTPAESTRSIIFKNALHLQGVYAKDADTVGCTSVDLPYGVSLRDASVRATSFDAWETSRQRYSNTTDTEIALGKKAHAYLQSLMTKGDFYIIPPSQGSGRDNFGRLLGDFYIHDAKADTIIDVAFEMKKAGYIRQKQP